MTPKVYAQIGEALFNKDWVYQMRALLDLRKPEAEQIAVHAARGLAYPMPAGLERPLRAALEAKRDQVRAALTALDRAAPGVKAADLQGPGAEPRGNP